MRFTACACKPEHYRRGHRPGWLKLMTSRGLYHCYCCDAVLLLPQYRSADLPAFQSSVPQRLAVAELGMALEAR